MFDKPLRILAINPGTKYLGIAILNGSDLRYWGIKVFKGKWSKEKANKIKRIVSGFIDDYDLNVLAVKKIHQSRTSKNLNNLVSKFKGLSRNKAVAFYQYSLKELRDYFSPGVKINKRQMTELIVPRYPFLIYSFLKEKRNKNPYFIRMFEAIALGTRCFDQIDH